MSQRKKIIILSTFLSPLRSGAEACAEEIALRLCGQHDITIVTARMRRDLPHHDSLNGKVSVIRVGFGCGLDKWLFPFLSSWTVWRLSKNHTKDGLIIHAILETFAGLALHFCCYLVPKAKRILTLQTTNRSFLKGFIIRSADHITAISSVLVSIAKSKGQNDVTLIPNGIDLARIPDGPKVSGRILFVGRLEKWKGVDVLLTAFAGLGTRDVYLRIVGDGSARASLENLAQELKISDRVEFMGWVPVPDVYTEFAQAEIFCGLSRSEALGNVFLEAQAAGCAVIGTNVGGIPDSVEDGVTGLLVSMDDVEAAKNALIKLLEDSELRQKLVTSAKDHVKKYDWGKIADRYSEVYEKLL